MSAVLVATSGHAKSRDPADIPLQDGGTSIGRNPSNGLGRLPANWAQISGNHCRIIHDEQGYHVHDTSTNGTWIVSVNGHKVRVPKRESLPIRPGQTVRLSTLAEGADRNTVPEYRLDLVIASAAAISVATAKAAPEPALQSLPQSAGKKRPRVSGTVDPAPSEYAQINQLHERYQAVISDLAQQQEERAQLQKALEEEKAAHAELAMQVEAKQNAAEQAEAAALQERIAVQNTHAAELAERLEAINEISRQRTELQECHKEEVRKVAAVSRERDEALASAQAERQALKALEVSQAAEAQQLRDLVAARDQQLQEMQERLDSAEVHAAGSNEKMAEFVLEAENLRSQAEAAVKKTGVLEQSIRNLEMELQFKDAAQRNLQRVSASLLPAVEADSGGEADALALLLNAQQRRVSHHAVAIELREMLPDAAVTGHSGDAQITLRGAATVATTCSHDIMCVEGEEGATQAVEQPPATPQPSSHNTADVPPADVPPQAASPVPTTHQSQHLRPASPTVAATPQQDDATLQLLSPELPQSENQERELQQSKMQQAETQLPEIQQPDLPAAALQPSPAADTPGRPGWVDAATPDEEARHSEAPSPSKRRRTEASGAEDGAGKASAGGPGSQPSSGGSQQTSQHCSAQEVAAEQHDPDETLAGDAGVDGGAGVDGTSCENRAESDANDYAAVVATVAETTAADRSSSLAESGNDDSGSGSEDNAMKDGQTAGGNETAGLPQHKGLPTHAPPAEASVGHPSMFEIGEHRL